MGQIRLEEQLGSGAPQNAIHTLIENEIELPIFNGGYDNKDTDGAMVIGIGHSDGKMDINPQGQTKLKNGQVLLTIGTTTQLDALRKMAG